VNYYKLIWLQLQVLHFSECFDNKSTVFKKIIKIFRKLKNFFPLQPFGRQVLWIKVTQKTVNYSLCVTN